MRNFNHDFNRQYKRNRDGSLATQHDRESIQSLIANQLDEGRFLHLRAPGIWAAARREHQATPDLGGSG